MFSVAESRSAMMLLWTKRKMATAMSPRMAVARMISSKVKPRTPLRLLAVNIKLNLARLGDAAPFPFRRQRHKVHPVDLRVIIRLQRRGHRFLHQQDVAVTRRDFRFL